MSNAYSPRFATRDTADMAREIEALEAERDALALRLAVIEDAGVERAPAEIVRRLSAGESPVRVWREYRDLTLRALAAEAGISPSMLSEIENGEKDGSVRTLAALAGVLRVDVDDLLPWT
jgi:DNA-binding XRE family transcriptional regulator